MKLRQKIDWIDQQKTLSESEIIRLENTQLRDYIRSLNEQLLAKSEQLSLKTTQLFERTQELEYFRSMLKTKQLQQNAMREEIEWLRRQNMDLKMCNLELGEIVEGKQRQILWMGEQLEELMKVPEAMQSQLKETANSQPNQNALSHQPTSQIDSLYQQIQHLSRVNNQIHQFYSNQLFLIRSANDKSIQQLKLQIQNLQFTVSNYKALFHRDNAKLESTLISLTQLQSQNFSLFSHLSHQQQLSQTLNHSQTILKMLESKNLSFQEEILLERAKVSEIQQQNWRVKQELLKSKNDKESIREVNNCIGQRLREWERECLQLRFKLRNLEYENGELRKEAMSRAAVEEEYLRQKEKIESMVAKYRDNILVEDNPNEDTCLISQLLTQSKQSTTAFIVQLRQDYQLAISTLQHDLKYLQQHTPSYNNIAQQLCQVERQSEYCERVAQVKEDVLRGEVERLRRVVREMEGESVNERERRMELVLEVTKLKMDLQKKRASERDSNKANQRNRSALCSTVNKQNKQNLPQSLYISKLLKQNRTLAEQLKTLQTISSLQLTINVPSTAHSQPKSSFIVNNYNHSQFSTQPQYYHFHGDSFYHHNQHETPTTEIEKEYFECQARYEGTIQGLIQERMWLEREMGGLREWIGERLAQLG